MTRKLVHTGVATALICALTIFPSIPVGGGYVHLGDSLIIAFSYLFGWWGVLAAGIGSALADIISAYLSYAVVTLFIKALMSVVCVVVMQSAKRANVSFPRIILAAALCELVMLVGYFLYEWGLIGIVAATGNVLFSLGQAGASLALGSVLVLIFEKRDLRALLIDKKKFN